MRFQIKVLFQILAGSRKLSHYRILPDILRFLRRKEHASNESGISDLCRTGAL